MKARADVIGVVICGILYSSNNSVHSSNNICGSSNNNVIYSSNMTVARGDTKYVALSTALVV